VVEASGASACEQEAHLRFHVVCIRIESICNYSEFEA